ncbi:nickel pincer cofactor biosynthesis protein LarC [Paenibacillus sp. OV219]|uniref:nickel pincer cofactor biosynthesis protein LarC n=1 Tax=Paenibacillus sp. OV219 TaxID=1884377 RepID=UPI0008C1FCE4|nr:nickel pincer cofactor biosynthesis protein LarC [Paenibacillus sp. OV219]SEM92946.1 hypothetical protein SAMN05518847_1011173 [Paenibacillus sp. OV219]
MKILYFDCFSGISGDMTLAALVDAGADKEYVERELAKIRIEPFTLQWKRVSKQGISALKMDVLLESEPQDHRHYSEIVTMIRQADFNERVVSLSLAIFDKIGTSEAKIHNIPVETVHFHEVGAIDSIVDVIGAALALDSLGIERIYCSPVPLGSGTVKCSHGLYPVPAPATLEMMVGLPIAATVYRMEMTTPTGAGIVSGIVDEFSSGLPPMVVESIGYGAGTRDLPDQPNVLRVVVGTLDQPRLDRLQLQALHGDGSRQPHEEAHKHGHRHGHDHEHVHEHDHQHGDRHEHDHSRDNQHQAGEEEI